MHRQMHVDANIPTLGIEVQKDVIFNAQILSMRSKQTLAKMETAIANQV